MRIICETTTDFAGPPSVFLPPARPIYVVSVLSIVSTRFRVNKPTFCAPVEKESGVSRFESRITESTEDPLDRKKARDQDGWMK